MPAASFRRFPRSVKRVSVFSKEHYFRPFPRFEIDKFAINLREQRRDGEGEKETIKPALRRALAHFFSKRKLSKDNSPRSDRVPNETDFIR